MATSMENLTHLVTERFTSYDNQFAQLIRFRQELGIIFALRSRRLNLNPSA